MKTMQKDSMMPAMPTTHVSRRKRMTPKMFCRHGRYTPMKVPMRGACQRGQHQSLPGLLTTNCLTHASSTFLPCLSSLAAPLPSLFPQVLTCLFYSLPASRTSSFTSPMPPSSPHAVTPSPDPLVIPLSRPLFLLHTPSPIPPHTPPKPHLHRLLFSTLIIFCFFVFSTSLGQVSVVGQPTEQRGHHGAGVHLLLWRKTGSVLGSWRVRGAME